MLPYSEVSWKDLEHVNKNANPAYNQDNMTATTCVVAQCSVQDDFSSEGKTLKFDCLPRSNPVTDLDYT